MTVEVFERGSNFKLHLCNFWNVDQVLSDSGKYILVINGKLSNTVLDALKVEFKIS
jgi:nitrate reductase NapAB chaperone NapD